LYFKYADGKWTWSPDKTNWMSVGDEIVSGGEYDGKSPVQENIDLLDRLHGIQESLNAVQQNAPAPTTSGDDHAGVDTSTPLTAPRYAEIKFYWRGFISSDMKDGFWLDTRCPNQPHEYLGDLPRYPLVNLLGRLCFRTDSRGYSGKWEARSRFNVKVVFSASGVDIAPHVPDADGADQTSPYSDRSITYNCVQGGSDCGKVDCDKRSSGGDITVDKLLCYNSKTQAWSSTCDGDSVITSFHVLGAPSDPCTPPGTPKVDFYFGASMSADGQVVFDGAVDAFPWYEAGAIGDNNENQLWSLDPKEGKGPLDLIGGANQVIAYNGHLPPPATPATTTTEDGTNESVDPSTQGPNQSTTDDTANQSTTTDDTANQSTTDDTANQSVQTE